MRPGVSFKKGTDIRAGENAVVDIADAFPKRLFDVVLTQMHRTESSPETMGKRMSFSDRTRETPCIDSS